LFINYNRFTNVQIEIKISIKKMYDKLAGF